MDPPKPPLALPEHEKLFTAQSWMELNRAIEHTVKTGEPYELELEFFKADGAKRWMLTVGELVIDSLNYTNKVGLQGTAQDITDRKNAEIKMRELAFSDSLTGVANRTAFSAHVEHSIKMNESNGGQSVVLLFDVDRFKIINDSYGHSVGDAVLKNVSSILAQHTRNTDIVARLGGDEFAIFFNSINRDFNVNKKVTKIIKQIEQPINVDGQSVIAGVSAGVSFYPEDADNKNDLLKYADLALYEAKKIEGSTFQTYRQGMAFPSNDTSERTATNPNCLFKNVT